MHKLQVVEVDLTKVKQYFLAKVAKTADRMKGSIGGHALIRVGRGTVTFGLQRHLLLFSELG